MTSIVTFISLCITVDRIIIQPHLLSYSSQGNKFLSQSSRLKTSACKTYQATLKIRSRFRSAVTVFSLNTRKWTKDAER